jgi:membrane protease YdiL (CAAX protease family)
MMPSTGRVAIEREPGEVVAPAVALATAGVALLALRVRLIGYPSAPVLFTAIYALLGVASLAVPIGPQEGRRLSPAGALALGAGAMALATVLGGPVVPVRLGSQALALNSLAAVSEEAFFRRFLYGRLAPFGVVAAVAATALLFALVHVPAYGMAAFWVDLGAGVLLSWQRWASGTWTVPAATHVAANLLVVLP